MSASAITVTTAMELQAVDSNRALATSFVVIPRRWTIERTFSRLMHHRRLARITAPAGRRRSRRQHRITGFAPFRTRKCHGTSTRLSQRHLDSTLTATARPEAHIPNNERQRLASSSGPDKTISQECTCVSGRSPPSP
ncbi:hypothetical protein GTY41_13220 [Streptomyces sp. SID685]|nr:hypothetical protein [Streptomyces sp. SID685]